MNETDFRNLNFTVIGKDCDLEGDLVFAGDTLVNSRIKGNLTIKDEGKLTLERGSFLDGNIYCHDAEIFGEVKGSINAAGTLSIKSGASVSGTLKAKKLSIFPGATINIEGHTQEDETES